MAFAKLGRSSQPSKNDIEAVKEPLQDDQHHHYQHSQSFPKGSTSRLWTRKRQRLWLLFHFFWRWLITAALVAAAAGVLVAYERRHILSTSDKHIFNFLITGLVIAIGVNSTGALSHFAGKGKWLFLSRQSLPPRLFELVMELDSQTKILKLLIAAKGRWMIRSFCLFWLLVNIGIQVLAALLGLTYSIANPLDVGNNAIETARGNASVVDLSFIGDYSTPFNSRPKAGSPNYLNSQRASASAYGQQSNEWSQEEATQKTFIGYPTFFTNYYDKLTKTKWRWLIRFNDFPSDDLYFSGLTENVASLRAIGATAVCDTKSTIKKITYGVPSTLSFARDDDEYSITVANNTWNSTTYISDTRPNYGDRTTRVLVFWSGVDEATQKPLEVLFDCNSTLTEVKHLRQIGKERRPVRDELQLPDVQARIIAGGVGWSGFNSNDTFQSHSYAANSRWSFNVNLRSWAVADYYVSRFAIGAINAMNFNAPRIRVGGLFYPIGGVILVVKWSYAGTVLGIIAGVHLILLILADVLLCKVLIRDDGPFATAVFLRPLLSRLTTAGGGMLEGEEIADRIGQDVLYTWDDRAEEGDSDDTEYNKGPTDVRYLKAKMVHDALARRKFDDGVYD